MKFLGYLNARALEVGDFVQVVGIMSTVTHIDASGAVVNIETDRLRPFILGRMEKVAVYTTN